jgi:5-(carboxyamino)imidazole ribonucleotide mutase
MPAGVPVATVAIGKAGATNAALLAAGILGLNNSEISSKLQEFRAQQTQAVLNLPPPSISEQD